MNQNPCTAPISLPFEHLAGDDSVLAVIHQPDDGCYVAELCHDCQDGMLCTGALTNHPAGAAPCLMEHVGGAPGCEDCAASYGLLCVAEEYGLLCITPEYLLLSAQLWAAATTDGC